MTKDRHPFGEVTEQRAPSKVEQQRIRVLRPRVRWTDARGTHQRFVDRRLTVGAAEQNDIVIADPAVSRIHAELEPRATGLWVRDLRSRNGTYVGGVLVEVGRASEGDTIMFGATTLHVQHEEEESDQAIWSGDRFGPLVGRSARMRTLFAKIAAVAPLDVTILLEGETGTGKELVARAIHEASARAKQPLITVDCGAMNEGLLEAELFGHTRGAFTGAQHARVGALEEADGGTVFLDEIGELPITMQPKLLRVLESRTLRRIGENQYRKVDTRFVAATHRDLRAMVNAGAFREDLYFRLAVVRLEVPPLRERREDIELLVDHFAPNLPPTVPRDALLKKLHSDDLLGNVRELRNYVDRVSALGIAEAGDEPMHRPVGKTGPMPSVPLDVPLKVLRDEWLEHLEREYIGGLLRIHKHNVSAVALAAGLDRSYVHRLIKKHQL